MEKLEDIKDFLEYYYKKYKIPFRVQYFRKEPRQWINFKGRNNKDKEWIYYVEGYGEPNHREPLPCEIVLDIDYHFPNADRKETKEAFKITLQAITKKLEDLHLSYSLWKSGGSGYHYHLFFDELKKYSKFERDELKRAIVRYLAYGFLTPHNGRANVDMPVMITVENSTSRKNKRKKNIVWKMDKKNKIPQEIMIKYEVSKDLKKYLKKTIPLTNGEPNSIKFFLSSDMGSKDGKKRVSFVLASWYAQKFKNDYESVYQKLYDWNEYTLRGYLSKRHLLSTVRSVIKSKSRVTSRYRNRLLEEIGAKEFKDEN